MQVTKFVFDASTDHGMSKTPKIVWPDRLPFYLDSEFKPVDDLNAWLLSLQHRRVRSPLSWSEYANDVGRWVNFLDKRGLNPVDDPDLLLSAVETYRSRRLSGGKKGKATKLVGPATWNRTLSALENFYEWAVEQRLMTRKPFRYSEIQVRYGEHLGKTVQHNHASAKAGSRGATMRHLESDFADLFIEVGLAGRLPDGSADPMFRGRLGVRNRALGALVRSSGLRRQEFSNLLVWEVPRNPAPFEDRAGFEIPAVITKGMKGRSTWLSSDAIEIVHDYIALEREMATRRSTWLPDRPLCVSDPTPESGVVNGRRVAWKRLTIAHRQRLVGPNGGSALLFLKSDGGPLPAGSWRYTFAAASARARRFDPRFPVVTPHMLRHTMAMETLNWLTRNQLRVAMRLAEASSADPILIAVLRTKDPQLILRDMLGHSSLLTTVVYLKAQDPESILSEAEWELLREDEDLDELWELTS